MMTMTPEATAAIRDKAESFMLLHHDFFWTEPNTLPFEEYVANKSGWRTGYDDMNFTYWCTPETKSGHYLAFNRRIFTFRCRPSED